MTQTYVCAKLELKYLYLGPDERGTARGKGSRELRESVCRTRRGASICEHVAKKAVKDRGVLLSFMFSADRTPERRGTVLFVGGC